VMENVRTNEDGFRAGLEQLLELPHVRSINGLGYLLAIELSAPDGTELPQRERTSFFRERLAPELRKRGLICRLDDRVGAIIQLAPPLVAGPEELGCIASILGEALAKHVPDGG